MNYQDRYSRFHNKPVTEQDPFPCNNANLYSAYYKKLVPEFKINSDCALICSHDFVRHPKGDKVTVPMSRDEILGLAEFGYISDILVNGGWSFSPYPLPKFSLVKLVKQLWELRPVCVKEYTPSGSRYHFALQHRNYFWQNNLDQLYRFAFRVPFSDRAFILKKYDEFSYYNPIHLFYAAFGKLSSFYKPNGLDWLKYGGKGVDALRQELPEGHPIRQKLGL